MRRVSRWVDDRLGASRFVDTALNKVFPDHWSFMLGEIAFYCFLILVITGVFLTFFFVPSSKEVTYHGSYKLLKGVEMSEAYRSTVRISWDVRAGLVMRQIHHWTALVFAAAAIAHLMRVFFTGAFRRPRELNWAIGVTLLSLVIANGFTGYSLPDDLLSGTGLRIAYSIVLSIPFIGTWLTFLIFGGEFPGPSIISRLYVIHIFIVPALIAGALGAHLAILWRQKHTQFAGPKRTERNVVGSHLWPSYTAKSLGLFFMLFAIVAALGGLAQINPIWLYGPFKVASVSTAAQPDWYIGWLEGALRLMPPWEIRAFGRTLANPFFPAVLLPGITFVLLYMWPWLEARFTGDYDEHNILDRPRDRPIRSALGAATFTFYAVIGLAGGQDIIAQQLHVSINDVLWGLRVLLFVGPVATAVFVYKLCRDLRAHEEHGGGHEEEHAEPPPPEPQAPPEHETPELVGAGAGATGVARPTAWGRRDVDPGDRGSAGARTPSDPVEPD